MQTWPLILVLALVAQAPQTERGVPLLEGVPGKPYPGVVAHLEEDEATYVVTLEDETTARAVLPRSDVRELERRIEAQGFAALSFETDGAFGRERRAERATAIERETPRERRAALENEARRRDMRLVEGSGETLRLVPARQWAWTMQALQTAAGLEASCVWPSRLDLPAVRQAPGQDPAAQGRPFMIRGAQALIALAGFSLAGYIGLKFLP
jgi:hypothetical protein